MSASLARRRVWPLPLVLLIAGSFSFAASGDTPEPTYHANVSEVQLTFSATDQNDHGIATLQTSDFAIVDKERVVRNPRSLRRAEFTRLEVVILVDASASIRTRLPREMAKIAWFMSQDPGISEDSVSIVSFQHQSPAIVCAGNCRTSPSAGQLPVRSAGLTPLYDSVLYSVDLLAQRADSHTRKVLILLSDGEDTISQHAAGDALQTAAAKEVPIYAVDTGSSGPGGAVVLRSLASGTGGRYYKIEDSGKVLPAVLQDLQATYTVTYQLPSRAAGYHDIRILPTHNLNLRFRCHGGYYYPGAVR